MVAIVATVVIVVRVVDVVIVVDVLIVVYVALVVTVVERRKSVVRVAKFSVARVAHSGNMMYIPDIPNNMAVLLGGKRLRNSPPANEEYGIERNHVVFLTALGWPPACAAVQAAAS